MPMISIINVPEFIDGPVRPIDNPTVPRDDANSMLMIDNLYSLH